MPPHPVLNSSVLSLKSSQAMQHKDYVKNYEFTGKLMTRGIEKRAQGGGRN
jgi:hypothetical protein